MKIAKVLNNNTVVIIENNNEVIVIGKGIGFQKKKGDLINPNEIDKKFCLSSDSLNAKFREIIASIPTKEIYVVEKIINTIKINISRKISDSIDVSLCDHIHFALKNHSSGIQVPNNLLYDIMRYYPDEYKVGKISLDIIKEETGVQLSDDEAGFIALHIVNAQTTNPGGTDVILKSTVIIDEVVNIIKDYFDKEITEDSLAYYRFINHLRYFAQRIVKKETFVDKNTDDTLLNMLKERYSDSYMCAMNIKGYLKGRYAVDIGKEEILYLTIHIQRAIFNN